MALCRTTFAAIALCAVSVSVSNAGLEYYVADESGFNTRITSSAGPMGQILLLDDGTGVFGSAPTAGTGNASVSRSGTSGGQSFSYSVSDVNFATGQPYASSGTLSVGNDILSTSTISVEAVAAQGGASTGSWGVDSISSPDSTSVGGIATPNAAIFDFTSSATAVDHFGVTLLDFESGFDNGDGVPQTGFIRVYDASDALVDSFAINLSAPYGNGQAVHYGIYATDGMTLDKVVFVLGDDNDTDTSNGWGGAEGYAATDFTLGFTNAVAAVPEPSALVMAGLLGFVGLLRRKRQC